MLQIGCLELLIILIAGLIVIGPDKLPEFVKFLIKTFTKLQNKFFEFRTSVERDIGAEDIRQDIFNELKMEEFEKEDDERPK